MTLTKKYSVVSKLNPAINQPVYVVQYTPAPSEPPNGPEHLEMYRRIQAAGRIVHIQVPAQNVEPLVRALDPALLMLDTWVPSRAEGEQLLEQCVKWTQL